jgi:hypothetical protein
MLEERFALGWRLEAKEGEDGWRFEDGGQRLKVPGSEFRVKDERTVLSCGLLFAVS